MSDNLKENWRENWLLCINRLTSFELQLQWWLDPINANPHWSYLEFMSCYIDDLDIHDDYVSVINAGFITTEEFKIIRIWHEALRIYCNTINDIYDHQAILDDRKWLEIIKMGLKQKKKLAEILNETERGYLM